jgi:hypothetical protein
MFEYAPDWTEGLLANGRLFKLVSLVTIIGEAMKGV